ncbi:MAG: endonuclease/exonuclease/phosphatase family protein [Methylococcales bacterium]|nr:endonuclease/exonuclease/phosphatase family protein [Methylococcales bacterium]
MKTHFNLYKLFSFLAILFFLPPPSLAAFDQSNAQCLDVANRRVLNVLTINILFSEIKNRNARLDRIAQFVSGQSQNGNPVDVILLQEMPGGILVNTNNSAKDFQKKLANNYGLDYNLSVAYSNGVPRLLTVFNATLSRCEIDASLWTLLPSATEVEFKERYKIPLTRSVLMTRLSVPGFGEINVYNTHLCSNCNLSERQEQAQTLMGFLRNVEKLSFDNNPIVLGGDFNTNLAGADPEEVALNMLITEDTEFPFVDSYAEGNNVGNPAISCIRLTDGSILFPEGCTIDVSGIRDPLGGEPKPARIDYIFTHGFGEIVQSRVVFTPFTTIESEKVSVSDHSAVFTSINLP